MSTAWIVVLALTAAISQDAASSEKTDATVPSVPAANDAMRSEVNKSVEPDVEVIKSLRKRTGRELLEAVRETLARLARPKDEHLEASVEELLFVHQELRDDEQMAGSQREYYRAKVESRLQQLSMQLKKRISRNKRLAKSNPPPQVRLPKDTAEQLGQRVAGGAPPIPPLGSGALGGRRRQPSDDYGQQLVDLIQETIAPSTWDVNGGLGTIYYWRPGRALVVRQTGEVHEKMGGVLGQLRRAGP